MKINIRKAKIEDLKKVQELNLLLFKKEHEEYDNLLNLDWTFGEEGMKYYSERIANNDGCVFVAETGGEIIGYLCGALTKPEAYRKLPITAELENTLVLEEYRSQGVGSNLYDEFVEWCKNKNVRKIKVVASAKNKGAIKFYRDSGFVDHCLTLESELK